jgi:hypothetical protein
MRALATVHAHSKHADEETWFIEPVVAEWWKQYVDSGALTKDFALPDSRVRASWAGDCSRSIAYHVAGVEESDPATVADSWRFNIGTLLHEHIQNALIAAFPGSVAEKKVRIGTDGSGHMDLWIVLPDGTTVAVEIKTINGTGYRRMVGKNPEGLRVKYLLQGALNAYFHEPPADQLLIGVFSLELMSDAEALKAGITDEYRRFASQWTYTKDQYTAIALEEISRLEGIIKKVDEQGVHSVRRIIPDPSIPPRSVIVSPLKGIYEIKDEAGRPIGTGRTWQCDYCPFQSHCAEDSA